MTAFITFWIVGTFGIAAEIYWILRADRRERK